MKLRLYIKQFLFLILVLVGAYFTWRFFFFEKRELNIQYPIPVELVIDGLSYQTVTNSKKVGDFLQEKNLDISSKDIIRPDLESGLAPHSTVFLVTNREVSIKVDGETKSINTTQKTIEKLLQDEKIKLNPFDIVEPGLQDLTSDDLKIKITRIEKKNVTEEEEIEYKTIIEEDDDLTFKKQVLEQKGKNGIKEVEYQYIYKNGKLISKTKLSSKVIQEPASHYLC